MRREHRHRQSSDATANRRAAGTVADGSDPLLGVFTAVCAPQSRAVPLDRAFAAAQRSAGNAAVQRLVVQRWALDLPADASCSDVLANVGTASPYSPEAAKTHTNFKYKLALEVSGSGKSYTASVSDPGVELDMSVDMPEWSPEGAMKQPWAKAMRELRDHEGEHERVGDETKTAMTTSIGALTATGTSDQKARDALIAKASSEWKTLMGQHKKDQLALDPYTVNINCPSP
jgi:hypothetical protein